MKILKTKQDCTYTNHAQLDIGLISVKKTHFVDLLFKTK